MTDLIVMIVVFLIVFLAARYIVREKKKGHGCIGCPHASKCGGNCHGNHDN